MVSFLGILSAVLLFVVLILGAFGVGFSVALPFLILSGVLYLLFWVCILAGVGKGGCLSSKDALKRYLDGEVDNSPF